MTEWRTLHAYSPYVDALLLDVVGPFFEAHNDSLDGCFWERHYVGGPNVRIRLRAPLDALVRELRALLERWLEARAAPPVTSYSAESAAELLRMEGLDPAHFDLQYRNGVVVEGRYPESGKIYVSAETRRLAEAFQCARGPLALSILRSKNPRHEEILRLFLALALFIGRGRYSTGSVSFKSHWEHFAATFSPRVLVQRVDENYRLSRERYIAIAREVEQGWSAERFAASHLLDQWWRLLEGTYARVALFIQQGGLLVEPSSDAQVRVRREEMLASRAHRRSDFLDAMWGNERYVELLQHEPRFQRPRALVNLLYDLVAAVGLNPIEKMALCHHAFRTAEEVSECNLNETLLRNVATVLRATGSSQSS